jgi:hypothetical protein
MKKIMLKIIVLLNSLLIGQYSFCQAPDIEWQNTIGGSAGDGGYGIDQTTDGGYIVGGYSSSGISGDKSETAMGTDFWILQLNSNGNIVWQNTIGGSGEDILTSIEQTTDEGFIIGGYSDSGISGDKTEATNGGNDYFIIKLNKNGSINWQNTIGGSADDKLSAIHQTTDGGYIVSGWSRSGITGDKTEPNMGVTLTYADMWILKLDSDGNIIWQNTIGGSSSDFAHNIAETTDGGFIIAGASYSGITGDKTEPLIGQQDFWVIKLNATGSIEWQNTIGGTDQDYLYSVAQTTDGGYILGGWSRSGISGDKTEPNIAGIVTYDYWIVKLNSVGAIIWQNTIGGGSEDWLSMVIQTNDDGYLVGGYSTSSWLGDKEETCYGNFDIWILKLNPDGTIAWQNTIGGSSDDKVYSIEQTNDNGYVLCGHSYSNIGVDKTENSLGLYDYWIIKLYPECSPIAETCNTLDDNCNGVVDEDVIETISISPGGATTFCQGNTVLLSATYSGTSVQWKKNGVNIPGATSSTYSVNKSGNYAAVTTSLCGTATSSTIIVTVSKNPNASISADGAPTFCAGGNVTLTEIPIAGCSYQWYKGASAIAGATSTNYIATTAGNYKCRVTKTASGCFKNSNIISVSVPCKEGEELINNNSISIFPNPNNGTFTINFSSKEGESTFDVASGSINIFNSLGQQIYSQQFDSPDGIAPEVIKLSNISPGIYIVRFFSLSLEDNGLNFYEQKLIIL